MNILNKIDKFIDEAKDQKEKSDIVCLECGKKFKKKITNFSEIKCPKCGGYDTEIA